MSIYKLDANDTTTNKIDALNSMVIEVNGKVNKGQFDQLELTQIHTDLGLNRKYKRNQSIGHTLSTYTGWSVLKDETGYSIWKFTISDYAYDSNNELYLDNKLLTFKGQAGAESATTFDIVYDYDGAGATYTDRSSEAGTELGTAFDLMTDTDDYLYIGHSTTFAGIKFEFNAQGRNNTLKVEYWNGSAWTQLTANSNDLDDDTSNFQSDGAISWTIPSSWVTTVVNTQTKYWIRISTTTTPVTVAKAYYIIPNNNVIGLLSLSNTQRLQEEWAWCSYGQSIYVTIRNTGVSSYEGDLYITSSSSTTNKQNFFVYNHEYTMNYQDSSFNGIAITTESGVGIGDMICVTDDYNFDGADADSYAYKAVGNLIANGVVKLISGLVTNVNTVGNGDIIAGDIIYLSTTKGKVTRTAPMGTGKIQQKLGIAITDEQSGNKVDLILQIDLYPTIL